MLHKSKAEISEHKMNDCVIIPVPKIDKGPSDPVNAIGVIVNQRNNMNCIGTQHGLLKNGLDLEIWNWPHQILLMLIE
ncbi:Hypothetical protein CINCED_3A007470 [Cinara cedri]|uniref:Uncharacterized protein n=1 Tax=Cinara cedri TaxID=506608 RepID=A0A5E4MRL3_9HEMI|nr:Hypothetical protein CINCED_3A007470 [Cinara cedri]